MNSKKKLLKRNLKPIQCGQDLVKHPKNNGDVAESSSSVTSSNPKNLVEHTVSAPGQCIFLFFDSNCQTSENFIHFPL